MKASRSFVAIRPTSYENAKEAAYLKTLFVGRSGEVENTTFVLLASDGKTKLSGVSRSPAQVFGNATRMIEAMRKIVEANPGSTDPRGEVVSPALSSVRLAVNVAACDNLPLVILGPKASPELEKEMTRLFFQSDHRGRFVLTRGTPEELTQIEGLEKGNLPQVVMVQPDAFGLKARVLSKADATVSPRETEATLIAGFKEFQPSAKEFQSHRIAGTQSGAFWETALPVTDPQEQRARDRHPAAPKAKKP